MQSEYDEIRRDWKEVRNGEKIFNVFIEPLRGSSSGRRWRSKSHNGQFFMPNTIGPRARGHDGHAF